MDVGNGRHSGHPTEDERGWCNSERLYQPIPRIPAIIRRGTCHHVSNVAALPEDCTCPFPVWCTERILDGREVHEECRRRSEDS